MIMRCCNRPTLKFHGFSSSWLAKEFYNRWEIRISASWPISLLVCLLSCLQPVVSVGQNSQNLKKKLSSDSHRVKYHFFFSQHSTVSGRARTQRMGNHHSESVAEAPSFSVLIWNVWVS